MGNDKAMDDLPEDADLQAGEIVDDELGIPVEDFEEEKEA